MGNAISDGKIETYRGFDLEGTFFPTIERRFAKEYRVSTRDSGAELAVQARLYEMDRMSRDLSEEEAKEELRQAALARTKALIDEGKIDPDEEIVRIEL